jgi:hypothetical protein
MYMRTPHYPTEKHMRQLLKQHGLMLALALPAVLFACGSSDEPSTTPIAGSYVATSFVTTGTSGQKDELAAGSTFQITLAANGSTTGHLHIAASGSDPARDADLTGTWSASGSTVNFDHAADTFIRDMPFDWSSNIQGISILTGDHVFSGTRIQVTLTRAS